MVSATLDIGKYKSFLTDETQQHVVEICDQEEKQMNFLDTIDQSIWNNGAYEEHVEECKF